MVFLLHKPNFPRIPWVSFQEVSRGAPPPDKKLIELQFVFAVVWALGGCLLADKATDHRAVFSSWWIAENKYVPYPDKVDCC